MYPRRRLSVVSAFILLVAAALLAAAPARAQIPGLDKVFKVAEAQREWTPEEEQAIGQATAAKLVAIFGLYENPAMVKYVNLVGGGVSQFAARQDIAYHFAILDTEMVNAFACPGGYIFVTRGLLANAEDEAELAGVLAHEVIHAADKHVEKELRSRKMAGIGTEAASEQAVSATGGVAGMALEQALKVAEKVVDQLLTGKLSRDKENDSDTKGVELAAAVGYDPRGYPDFLDWLGQASASTDNQRFLGNLTASHPKFSDRIKRLNELIAKRGWDKEERPRLAERYQTNVDFSAPVQVAAAEGTTAPAETSAVPAEVTTPSTQPAAGEEPATPTESEAASTPAKAAAKPAPATAPATSAAQTTGGGKPPALFFRPFSADQVATSGKERHRAKIFASEKAFRMEAREQGEEAITILRFDRRVMWVLQPSEKIALEMPMKWGNSFEQAAREPDAKVERTELGLEKVGPYLCTKFRVRVTSQGKTYSGIQWAAPELEGFVVKMMDEETKDTVEYENIRLGPPDPALFEIPPGYSKMTMPGMR